jgi:phage baseplate assembly protein W
MPVIISGIPKVGSPVQIVYSGPENLVESYEMYSGISVHTFHLAQTGVRTEYIPTNLDHYLKARVIFKDGREPEESRYIIVLDTSTDSYEESRISIIGNGLALTDVLPANVDSSRIVADVKRISQSIFIILSTSLAEIPMLDMLGSTLPYHLFKEVTNDSIETLKNHILDTLAAQEPRISVENVEILYDGEHTLSCTIDYTVVNTNIKSSYIYNVSVGD